MAQLYVCVAVPLSDDGSAMRRLRTATGRAWLEPYRGVVRYWVATEADADAECATLALAGFRGAVEHEDFQRR